MEDVFNLKVKYKMDFVKGTLKNIFRKIRKPILLHPSPFLLHSPRHAF